MNKAKFIGITSYSRYRFSAYETIRTIKKELPDCKIVAGGRHFSSLAVETLQKLPEVDFVVDNEGEVTLKELCDIPIIYDPSHSTGYRNFVPAISLAAIAAGADGLIVESHPNPEKSISDADQAITLETLEEIIDSVK